MLHDAEYGAGRAMSSEAARAPGTTAAGEIDFANDTFP
jgi:hypothetical protein